MSIGAFILYGLFTIGFLAILGAPNVPEESQRSELILGVVLWILGGLLLQALPVTGGVQFIPLFPWYYIDGPARIVSIICWMCILAGCVLGILEKFKYGATFLVAAMVVNAMLSFASPIDVTVADNPPDTIAHWERLRNERSATLSRLLSDKERLIDRIRSLGAKNKKGLMANPIGKTLVEELEQLCQQIAATQKEIDAVDTSTERAKSQHRIVERQELLNSGKLTEKDYEQMFAASHTVDEDRTPDIEVRRDQLLDQLFNGDK
jgi:hypothetical protein